MFSSTIVHDGTLASVLVVHLVKRCEDVQYRIHLTRTRIAPTCISMCAHCLFDIIF